MLCWGLDKKIFSLKSELQRSEGRIFQEERSAGAKDLKSLCACSIWSRVSSNRGKERNKEGLENHKYLTYEEWRERRHYCQGRFGKHTCLKLVILKQRCADDSEDFFDILNQTLCSSDGVGVRYGLRKKHFR